MTTAEITADIGGAVTPGTRYTSDTHCLHANIIHYCHRPYKDAATMTEDLLTKLRAAEQLDPRIIHAGDIAFDLDRVVRKHGNIFQSPDAKVYVGGNHDRMTGNGGSVYAAQFGTVVGTERTWKSHGYARYDILDGQEVLVLVSHKPQTDLCGADVNVYGHVHNNIFVGGGSSHHPEDDWGMQSDRHFCACVELHDGHPQTLQELANAKRTGYPLVTPWMNRYAVLYPDGPPPRNPRR